MRACCCPRSMMTITGRAADLGALDLNQPEPHYGPRWITWKPFYR